MPMQKEGSYSLDANESGFVLPPNREAVILSQPVGGRVVHLLHELSPSGIRVAEVRDGQGAKTIRARFALPKCSN